MAQELQPCCQQARREYVRRLTKAIASYPVIKDLPCPTCRRVIQIRIYTPPDEAGQTA
jgi:hypothetical protein